MGKAYLGRDPHLWPNLPSDPLSPSVAAPSDRWGPRTGSSSSLEMSKRAAQPGPARAR
jgi:hypothetical protein